MVDLARHSGNGPVGRQDIAERQDISSDYVAQLFGHLQDAGRVEGVRGPGEGYRLTREPSDIQVREIVEALEGPVTLAPCLEQRDGSVCPQIDQCTTRSLWNRLSMAMREWLDSYTLQDLSRDARHSTEPRVGPARRS